MPEVAQEQVEDAPAPTDDAPPADAAPAEVVEEEGDRVEGEVKWFDVKKGFGFVDGPEGEDVFVHFSAITGDGFRVLKDGEKISYVLSQGDKGLSALAVKRLAPPAPPEPGEKEPSKSKASRKERRQKRQAIRKDLSSRDDPKQPKKDDFPQEKPTTVGKRETDLYHGLPLDDPDEAFVG
ncbi:MAG: cold shock domain-containing protein [Planctomycetota bacterium]